MYHYLFVLYGYLFLIIIIFVIADFLDQIRNSNKNKSKKKIKYHIIGISGLKRNGKDTIANYLCDNYGYQRIAFADPLKEVARVMFEFNDEQLYGSEKEVVDEYWQLTPRQALNFVGIDLIKNNMDKLDPKFGKNFWIHCAKRKVDEILKENPDAVIVFSDVRYPDECELIRKLNGFIIRVERPCYLTVDSHESESHVMNLKVDAIIQNDGSIDDLHKRVSELLF